MSTIILKLRFKLGSFIGQLSDKIYLKTQSKRGLSVSRLTSIQTLSLPRMHETSLRCSPHLVCKGQDVETKQMSQLDFLSNIFMTYI